MFPFDDPGFQQYIQTGQVPPQPPQPQVPQLPQPPQIQPLAPMPLPQKVTMGNAQGAYSAATGRLAKANADVGAVQQFQNDYVAAKTQPAREASTAEQNANIAKRAEEEARVKQGAAEIHQRAKDLAQEGIDPFRLVNKAETWQKVLMGISMAVSGFISPKGPNLAYEAIMKLLAADTEAQSKNLKHKKDSLDLDRELNKDEGAASKAGFLEAEERRLMQLEAVKQAALSEASRMSSNPAAVAKANQLVAMAEAEGAKIALGAAGHIETARISASASYAATAQREKESLRENAFNTVKMGTDILENAAKRDAEMRKTEIKSGGDGAIEFNGKVLGTVTDKKERGQVKAYIKAHQDYKKLINDALGYEAKTSKAGSLPLVGQAMDPNRKLAKQALAAARLKLKEMLNLGAALTGTEVKPLDEVLPADSEAIFTDPTRQMRRAIEMADSEARTFADLAEIDYWDNNDSVTQAKIEEKYEDL